MIFISHKLHEVKAVADRVTVLRGGRAVATVDAADATPRELAALMVGREVELARRVERATPPRDEAALYVEGLSRRAATGARRRCATSRCPCGKGEIVGVAGVAGNGQRELAEAITGMRPLVAGSVHVRRPEAARRRSARGDRAPESLTFPRTGSAPASRRASASPRTRCSSPIGIEGSPSARS